MLNIDIRPYKGILFVRLGGKLNKDTKEKLNKEVIALQQTVGIKNIIFNIEDLQEIDSYGENALKKSFNICENNQGKSYICLGHNKHILNNINEKFTTNNQIIDELSIFDLINS